MTIKKTILAMGVVHLQNEPPGTPGAQCSAACGVEIDDPPSQLAIDREFVTCRACHREAIARWADDVLPRLGDLVREGKLVLDPSTGALVPPANPPTVIRRHQELTDDEIDRTTLEGLRAAYRSLRDHHVAETTTLVAKVTTAIQQNQVAIDQLRAEIVQLRNLNAPSGGEPR